MHGGTVCTMPSAPLTFRPSCGSFFAVFQAFMAKRASLRAAMRIAMLSLRCRADGAMLGLLLTLTFWGGHLMQCGDVESNPGPDRDALRQTTLTTGGGSRSRSASAGTGRGSTSSSQQAASPPLQQLSLEDLMAKMDSMDNNINCKFADVEKGLKDLTEQYGALQTGVNKLRREMGDLKTENDELKSETKALGERVTFLENKVDDLEARSKRNNIILHGIPRKANETWQECEDEVRGMISGKLEFSDEVKFDRVHRVSSKPNSPIVARCTFFKDKDRILRSKQKLKGTKIFIGEDFSARVREMRRKLVPHLKEARNQNKRAAMVYDHLVIDGQKFGLDGDEKLIQWT